MQETNRSFATMERRIPTYSPKAVRRYRGCRRVEQSQAWYPLVRCSGAFLLLSHSTRCRDVCSRTTVSGARTAFNRPTARVYPHASGLQIVLKLLRDVLSVRAVRRSTAAYERRRDHGWCSWRIASMFSGRTALWCLYLAGVIALFVVTFINYVVEGFFSTLSGYAADLGLPQLRFVVHRRTVRLFEIAGSLCREHLANPGRAARYPTFVFRPFVPPSAAPMGRYDGTVRGALRAAIIAVLHPNDLGSLGLRLQVFNTLESRPVCAGIGEPERTVLSMRG